jgi:thiamine biosynthesis protein ThiS
MTAIINGKPRVLPEGSTISDLLQVFTLPAKNVLVERNGQPVARDTFNREHLEEGDQIEIISMVAGG